MRRAASRRERVRARRAPRASATGSRLPGARRRRRSGVRGSLLDDLRDPDRLLNRAIFRSAYMWTIAHTEPIAVFVAVSSARRSRDARATLAPMVAGRRATRQRAVARQSRQRARAVRDALARGARPHLWRRAHVCPPQLGRGSFRRFRGRRSRRRFRRRSRRRLWRGSECSGAARSRPPKRSLSPATAPRWCGGARTTIRPRLPPADPRRGRDGLGDEPAGWSRDLCWLLWR